MSICSCLYPLHIVDKRDGGENDPIEYLAFPQEVIDELGIDDDNGNGDSSSNGYRKFKIPKIKFTREKGLDGIEKDWVKVIWASSLNATTKKYDVNGHVIVVGCDLPVKCKTGHKCKVKCEEKEVYEVLHPLDEWHGHHIVEI
jgi:hypothetical protein